jgi:hypothetical protein
MFRSPVLPCLPLLLPISNLNISLHLYLLHLHLQLFSKIIIIVLLQSLLNLLLPFLLHLHLLLLDGLMINSLYLLLLLLLIPFHLDHKSRFLRPVPIFLDKSPNWLRFPYHPPRKALLEVSIRPNPIRKQRRRLHHPIRQVQKRFADGLTKLSLV